jgi:hypothetical protein
MHVTKSCKRPCPFPISMMAGKDHHIPVIFNVIINDLRITDLVTLSDLLVGPLLANKSFQTNITEKAVKFLCKLSDLCGILFRESCRQVFEDNLLAITGYIISNKIQEIGKTIDHSYR